MPSNIETLAIIVLIVMATFNEYRASFAKETDYPLTPNKVWSIIAQKFER